MNRVTHPVCTMFRTSCNRIIGLEQGITFVELLITLAIFSGVMAGVCAVYLTQIRHSTREFMLAVSEMEFGIAKTVIERDIMMAGYGIADDYGTLAIDPIPVQASDAASLTVYDSISLRGTAIGILSRSSQGWSYMTAREPAVTFQTWTDSRENIDTADKVIFIDPNTKEILTEGTTAIFSYPAIPSSAEKGTLVYGLHSESANVPYYTVEYLLGGTPPSVCASGTKNLLRAESRNNDPPLPANREPILNCVRDFQVAFGLDTSQIEDGVIDIWDNGGTIASAYDRKNLTRRLKQVRVYVLVQASNRDPDYMYCNRDNPNKPDKVRVGDSNLNTGRDITLTAEQRRYRWEIIPLSITPRNLR
jgi:hypothetical protein